MTFLKFLLIGLVCYKAEAKFVYPRFDEINMARTLDERSDGCKYFDRLYEEGEVMMPTTSRKCEYLCTCHVYENYEGQFFCERLCQQYTDYICRPGWESKPVNVSAGPPEYGCFCEENHCVPSLGIDALVARLRLR